MCCYLRVQSTNDLLSRYRNLNILLLINKKLNYMKIKRRKEFNENIMKVYDLFITICWKKIKKSKNKSFWHLLFNKLFSIDFCYKKNNMRNSIVLKWFSL